ncbi:cell division protein ZapA [Nicoliella spurrieriana]|uniref:Cell division protein ZapA n=1 Tax=Nicoliella spurrieriana TaxID=2925830 RepID=A0A976RS61_9LACO|nr:cell division protein ZapA [Nicoliella spurrieriana]UQS86786.1 cell division protein ZapA [Nicoliella spurrieriana]
MSETKKRFKAKIGNRTYTFVGKSSMEHMHAVTDLMNKQLSQLNQLSASVSYEDAMVLLAFNAISDQLKLQGELDELKTDSKSGAKK